MELNEQLTWAVVGPSIPPGDDHPVSSDFLGPPQKVRLDGGFLLYRFNSGSRLGVPVSPWWSPYYPYLYGSGWEQRRKLAELFSVSVRELGRVTSAISEQWNSNAFLLVAKLLVPAWCFFGHIAGKPRLQEAGESRRLVAANAGDRGGFRPEGRGATAGLPGGATQFYLPNLAPTHLAVVRVESLLNQ